MRPNVSILIPCYNADRWVAQAIQSALDQTWPAKEVIVVDDGSTDRGLEIIKTFDGRIRWETGPNRGGNVARNRLLELARGEWLQYLDADDFLLPKKLQGQIEFLSSNADADVIFGPVMMEYVSPEGSRRELLPIIAPHDPWILLARWFLPQTGAPLWRKQALLDVGGWKPNQPCCQEHELYLRLLMADKNFRYSDVGGAVYRQWSEETVCKRNKPETHRRRLEILNATECFLQQRNELAGLRLTAINQARFEIARMAWLYDPNFARQIIATIENSQPDFAPGHEAAPFGYRAIFRYLGFRVAEELATRKRKLIGALKSI